MGEAAETAAFHRVKGFASRGPRGTHLYVYGAIRVTRPREEMDLAAARGFAPHPGNAGGDGAIHQSPADAADDDRPRQRDVLERAKASAPLPLDRSAADS